MLCQSLKKEKQEGYASKMVIGSYFLSFLAEYTQCLERYMRHEDPTAEFSEPALRVEKAPLNHASHYLHDYGTQALALFDANIGCVSLSNNWTHLTGLQPEEALGSLFFLSLHPDQRERVLQLIAGGQHVDAATPIKIKCRLRHADEEWHWYQLVLYPAHPDHSGNHETILLLHNIHEEIQVQHRMQKTKIDAELKEHVRSKFLGDISHDLRTPLNAIIGFTQLMESGIFGPVGNAQYHDYLRHIRESGYELLERIDTLLDAADEPLADLSHSHFRLREAVV